MSIQAIRSVFIIGAGTMGCEIALQCARHGVRVVLHDAAPKALEQAEARLKAIAHGLRVDVREALARISTSADVAPAAEADLIIEAVPENLELKRRIFAEVSAVCRPEAILATNTSSLIPSQLAASCRHPGRLAAFHFHLPVAISTVVDVMPHPGTDPAWWKAWRRSPAPSGRFQSATRASITATSSTPSSARCSARRSTW
ncbi:MAG: FAD-dependent oxidoreductase [Verrucomicrobiota bacterium]